MEIMSNEIKDLAMALLQAQAELKPAPKNASNPIIGSKYADLVSCIEASKPILTKHNLVISQICLPAERGMVGVRTLLIHATSGQYITSDVFLPYADNKRCNEAQAAGSAITYARRYGYCAVIGLLADDDDDGCKSAPMPNEKTYNKQPQQSQQTPKSQDVQANFRRVLSKNIPPELDARGKLEYAQKLLTKFFRREVSSSNELSVGEMLQYITENDVVSQQ